MFNYPINALVDNDSVKFEENKEGTGISKNNLISRDNKYKFYFRFISYMGFGKFYGDFDHVIKNYRTLTIGIGLKLKKIEIDATGDFWRSGKLTDEFIGYFEHYDMHTHDSTIILLANVGIRLGYCVYTKGIFSIIPQAGVCWTSTSERYSSDPNYKSPLKIGYQLGLQTNFLIKRAGKKRDIGGGTQHYLFASVNYGQWNLETLDLELGRGNLLSINFGYLVNISIF
jgi:hypothetical protein